LHTTVQELCNCKSSQVKTRISK